MSPFPFIGVTPPTAKIRVTLAKIRVTLHPARVTQGQHPQQELRLSLQSTTAPRKGETPPQALSSSKASLRGSYPNLSPHLRLPVPSGLLTTPAQTAGIRCLPPANFHPGHDPQLPEAAFTSRSPAPEALTEGGRKLLQPALPPWQSQLGTTP